MAFDFKKEYKDFYAPKSVPAIVNVPVMNYIAIRGAGNPNEANGAYQDAIEQLYGVAYTIKMSKMGDHRIDGYFDFVVPPLEGLWWQDGIDGIDLTRKNDYQWISMIRIPEFVTQETVEWAINEAGKKKKREFSDVKFWMFNEGLCVQIMHTGSYDSECSSIAIMDEYLNKNGYEYDFSDVRKHHEIYMSDCRKVAAEKLKTIIRHPIRKK